MSLFIPLSSLILSFKNVSIGFIEVSPVRVATIPTNSTEIWPSAAGIPAISAINSLIPPESWASPNVIKAINPGSPAASSNPDPREARDMANLGRATTARIVIRSVNTGILAIIKSIKTANLPFKLNSLLTLSMATFNLFIARVKDCSNV
ncbi:MAG: hypothetical protein BWZ03_00450 [bacterium ADurb.BinA186]|nr:MAG: hypothetical protein BWZ03_00450 [bacterium ADurb.BinA186]